MLSSSLPIIVIFVAVLALVVRLATLPVLWRAQRAVRQRELAAIGAGPAGGVGAIVAELAIGLAGGAGLAALLIGTRDTGPFGVQVLSEPLGGHGANYLSRELGLKLSVSTNAILIAGIVVLLLWLLLYYRTQRNVLHANMPPEVWSSSSVRLRVAGLLVLRALLGAVLLPIGVSLGALVFQVVTVLASRRWRSASVVAAQGAPAGAAQGAPVPPGFGPARPGAYPQPMPQPQPYPQPPVYVPTQAAPAPPTAGPLTPVGSVAHQPLHPNEPRMIGGYQLLGRIGSGGMGTVYLARREGAATQVALKTINLELLDNAELLRRFEREAEVLAMVSGAYTARVLDGGVDGGRPYLAMELLDGRPLDAHLREQGPIRSAEALRALALALAVALSGVHKLGLIHRDLKPANIMLTTAGPRLLDFGIAALVDGTRLTMTGGGPGTLTYMAPEQFDNERVGTAADVWAWACCVVCAAHGTSPFAATSTGAVIRRIVSTGPEPTALAAVQALDPALAAVVARALTPDPAGRPADGAALLELLTAHSAPGVPAPDAGTLLDEITRGWRTLAL
ncbi:serine/threonine-protein kinase [Kitasatospora sp. NPDC097643]|uniref:serine/threonine-protein kinase n=1 Tax=Kitasatospora sp. NPDC097643 TaxID=3157230 RepID=UPI00333393BE